MNYSKSNNDKRKKQRKSKSKKVKNKVGLTFFRVVVVVVLIGMFAAAGILLGAYAGIIEKAPDVASLGVNVNEGNFTTIVYSEKTGEELTRYDGGENREIASFSEIPINLQNAFLALEDERFYSHNGVDYKSFIRATVTTIMSRGANTQGGSTITQQLIKNKRGYMRNTIDTKIQEQYLAVQYEKLLTERLGSKEKAKEKILEGYLNIVGLGHGQVGVKAATLRYFNKEMADLTLSECAVIAAITQNPSSKNPVGYKDNNKIRATACLKKMLELEFINQAEYDEALAEYDDTNPNNVYTRVSEINQVVQTTGSIQSFYNEAVFDQVCEDLIANGIVHDLESANELIYNGGLKIYTPFDAGIQAIVDKEFNNEENFPTNDFQLDVTYILSVKNQITDQMEHYQKTGKFNTDDEANAFIEQMRDELIGPDMSNPKETIIKTPQPQAAMAIIDYYTGNVAAIAGARGEKIINKAFNRATDSKRQQGSVFKILASYAPAIDMQTITPATVIDDSSFTIKIEGSDDWTPRNWNHKFIGPVTIRDAIKHSMNVVTAKNLYYNVGLENSMNYLQNMGISTLDDSDLVWAISLGGTHNGVTQIEVAEAFGTIANAGMYNRPKFYTKVLYSNGDIALENNDPPQQVLKDTSAYLLTDMMKGVITGGTGTQAGFKEIDMPVAGKTGTTTGSNDLTFVGYTPYYVGSIWMGHDERKLMDNVDGGTHLRLWSKVMEQVHKDLPYKEFDRPEGIVTENICTLSGLKSLSGTCTDTRNEIFAPGTAPSEYCDSHTFVDICTVSGEKAGPYCPEEDIEAMPEASWETAQSETDAEENPDEPSDIPVSGICSFHTEEWYIEHMSDINEADGYLNGNDNFGIDNPNDGASSPEGYLPPTDTGGNEGSPNSNSGTNSGDNTSGGNSSDERDNSAYLN